MNNDIRVTDNIKRVPKGALNYQEVLRYQAYTEFDLKKLDEGIDIR